MKWQLSLGSRRIHATTDTSSPVAPTLSGPTSAAGTASASATPSNVTAHPNGPSATLPGAPATTRSAPAPGRPAVAQRPCRHHGSPRTRPGHRAIGAASAWTRSSPHRGELSRPGTFAPGMAAPAPCKRMAPSTLEAVIAGDSEGGHAGERQADCRNRCYCRQIRHARQSGPSAPQRAQVSLPATSADHA